jgi:hypothetical protein
MPSLNNLLRQTIVFIDKKLQTTLEKVGAPVVHFNYLNT